MPSELQAAADTNYETAETLRYMAMQYVIVKPIGQRMPFVCPGYDKLKHDIHIAAATEKHRERERENSETKIQTQKRTKLIK